MGFSRLHAAHIFFPHAPLLMTGRSRPPLGLLRAPFLANARLPLLGRVIFRCAPKREVDRFLQVLVSIKWLVERMAQYF